MFDSVRLGLAFDAALLISSWTRPQLSIRPVSTPQTDPRSRRSGGAAAQTRAQQGMPEDWIVHGAVEPSFAYEWRNSSSASGPSARVEPGSVGDMARSSHFNLTIPLGCCLTGTHPHDVPFFQTSGTSCRRSAQRGILAIAGIPLSTSRLTRRQRAARTGLEKTAQRSELLIDGPGPDPDERHRVARSRTASSRQSAGR